MNRLLVLAISLLSCLAWAITPAGTIIRNQAVVQVGAERYLSNVVETVVQALCVPSISPNGTLSQPGQRAVVPAGGFAYFAYLIQNTGNAPFSFNLSDHQQGSVPWSLAASDIQYFRDVNGNARRDPGEPQITSITLQASEEARLVVQIHVPQNASGEMNFSPIGLCPDSTADGDNYARIVAGTDPALNLEKLVEPKVLTPGSEATFTLRLRNSGSTRAAGPIYLSDALNTPELAGLSFVAGSASAPKGTLEYSSDGTNWGGSANPVNHIRLVSAGLEPSEETLLIFRMRVAANAVGGPRSNVAQVQGAGGPAMAQQEFTVVPRLEHHLGPLDNPRAITGGEGSPNDRQQGSAVAGQPYCFNHTLENSGDAADRYTLSLSGLPAGATGVFQTETGTPLTNPVSLQAGQRMDFRLCLTLPVVSANPVDIRLTATSQAGVQNHTLDQLTVLDPALVRLIKIQDVSNRVEANGAIVYTLRIENGLPIALTNLVIEDVLDANLEFISASDGGTSFTRTLPETPPRQVAVVRWTLPSLAAGASKDISLRVRVSDVAPEGTIVRNAFTLRSSEAPNPRESNTVSIPVDSINILLQKAVTPNRVSYGDLLTYTLTASNPFRNPLVTRVVDTPAAGLSYVPGSATPAEPSVVNGQLVWNNLTLQPGQPLTITYKMRVLPGAPQRLENKAQAFSVTSSGAAIASATTKAVALLNPGVFAPPHMLIGRVFLDANKDGLYTQGLDMPLPGARVVLTNGLQAVTDIEGRYSLRNLPGGIWEVFLDPVSALFKPLPHPEAMSDPYAHRVRVEGLTVSDFPLEMPEGCSIEGRKTVLEFGPLKVTKYLLPLPKGVRVVLNISSSEALPDFTLTDPLPDGSEKQFYFEVFEGEQTLTYDLPEGHLTDPQARWRYP